MSDGKTFNNTVCEEKETVRYTHGSIPTHAQTYMILPSTTEDHNR